MTILDTRAARRFAERLDQPDQTRTSTHRADDAELDHLVAVTAALHRIPVPNPDRDFRAGLRAHLIATADRDGMETPTDQPTPKPRGRRRWLTTPKFAVAAGVSVGLALYGVSVASGNANPGDALYGVKRGTEQAQLAVSGSDAARGALYLQLASVRLNEALAVRKDITGYSGALSEMDIDTLTGVRLLTTWAVTHHDPTALTTIDTFTAVQHATVDQLLQLVRDDTKATTRTTTSLALLDAVADRARTLRTAIACNATMAGQVDALGPIAAPCPTTTTSPGQTPTGQTTVTVGSDGQVTIVKPEGTTAPSSPTVGQTTGPSTPAPSPTSSPDGGLLGEVGRIVGGLLGSS